jgi:hypothetical protein
MRRIIATVGATLAIAATIASSAAAAGYTDEPQEAPTMTLQEALDLG